MGAENGHRKLHAGYAPLTYKTCCVLAAIALLWACAGTAGAAEEPAEPQKSGAKAEDEAPTENPFQRRIPCPELSGGVDWINTAGPLELKDLRGKFVLLDFWTYCCINCMHILPELKKLEEAYPNELVVIGVHSAKFLGEEDSQNITDAVLRYEIKHPVVNDAKHAIWDRFGVRSWPTMLVIDPEGQAVYGRSGEFKASEVATLLKLGIPYYRKKGTLDETPLRFDLAADRATDTPLRFPGKVLADGPGNRLFISDSNHNRIVVAKLDGTLIDAIGSGAIGTADGDFAAATFNHPQGMVLDGGTLYVADTENHMLRKVDLTKKTVTTIAGRGRQGQGWPGVDLRDITDGEVKLPERFVGKPRETDLNSPWDLWIHGRDLYIAMAGPHQIWKMPLDESEIGPFAGNGREDIVDGPLLPRQPYEAGFSSFAQPSGLASDGKSLFVADSEGSSIRALPFDPAGEVTTIVGTSDLSPGRRLFTFGDEDGRGSKVRLQHPLGVAFADGTLYVADTYNNKIKAIVPAKHEVKTIAGNGEPGHDDTAPSFDEPAGLTVAAGKLYVADTNSHQIRVVDLGPKHTVTTLEIRGLTPPTPPETAAVPDRGREVQVAPVSLKPADGLVWLKAKLTLPEGYKINAQAPMRYRVTLPGKAGPVDRQQLEQTVKVDPPATEFQVELPIASTGEETVEVALDYYYCREGAEGVCKAGRVTWIVPVKVGDSASEASAPLILTVD